MATENNNTSPAQNKLGELYVDFGTKGLGSLQKGLGSLAIGFKVAEKSAGVLVSKISQLSKEGITNATVLRKMSNTIGLSEAQLRAAQKYATSQKIDLNTVLSSIAGISDIMQRRSREGIPGGIHTAIATYGLKINPFDYGTSPQEATRYINDLRREINDMPAETKRDILAMHGLSEDLIDVFAQGEISFNEMTRVTQEDIKATEDLDKNIGELNDNLKQVGEQLSSWFAKGGTNTGLQTINKAFNGNSAQKLVVGGTMLGAVGTGAGIGAGIAGPWGVLPGAAIGGLAGILSIGKRMGNNQKSGEIIKSGKYTLETIEDPAMLNIKGSNSSSTIPQGQLTGGAANITNDVKINITSTDPQLAAEETQNKIEQIDYNSLQYYNNMGV